MSNIDPTYKGMPDWYIEYCERMKKSDTSERQEEVDTKSTDKN